MNPHLASEEMSDWIVGERTPEARNHIGACSLCRGEVEPMEHAFWQFRDSGRPWSEHWYAERETSRERGLRSWRRFAAAGGLVFAVAMLVLLGSRPAPRRYAETPFLQIPYAAPLAPYEQTRVMRMDVAMNVLKASGFEVYAPEMGGCLPIDVLVGQDGRAHAFRPVYRKVN
jgi:hypothetical protein